jgi:hypothetical protein
LKTPVVKSNNPSELQLVIAQLVKEINALTDRVKILEGKVTNGG